MIVTFFMSVDQFLIRYAKNKILFEAYLRIPSFIKLRPIPVLSDSLRLLFTTTGAYSMNPSHPVVNAGWYADII